MSKFLLGLVAVVVVALSGLEVQAQRAGGGGGGCNKGGGESSLRSGRSQQSRQMSGQRGTANLSGGQSSMAAYFANQQQAQLQTASNWLAAGADGFQQARIEEARRQRWLAARNAELRGER